MVEDIIGRVEIMCTLTVDQILFGDDLVKDMYLAGMRSVRINTAHLQGVEQLQVLASRLKSLLPDIRILIDTKGPEMRTTAIAPIGGGVPGDAEFHPDQVVVLRQGDAVIVEGSNDDSPTTTNHIYVNYPRIHTEVRVGHRMLIDDGRIALDVMAVDGCRIKCVVAIGGELGSRKGVSVCGIDLDLPPVSAHDRMYIRYAAASDLVDVIAHSFVRSVDDVMAVKAAMAPLGKPVIAKIENQQGIDNLDDIINEADGILIARGDLTASIGRDSIPQAQSMIAKAAKHAGRPLYLATNILPSMMASTKPSDVDLAGIDLALSQGVDVMLLTNETASGPRPLECVKALYNELHS